MKITIDTRTRTVNIDTGVVHISNFTKADFDENKISRRLNGEFAPKGCGGASAKTDTDTHSLGQQIDKALRGELKRQEQLQVFKTIPALYQSLGFKRQPVLMSQFVFSKATKDKHSVPVNAIRELPQLLRHPVCVLESKTEKQTKVAVINKKDNDGRQIIVALRPSNSGNYVAIPSLYGKDDIIKLIKSSKIIYKRPL